MSLAPIARKLSEDPNSLAISTAIARPGYTIDLRMHGEDRYLIRKNWSRKRAEKRLSALATKYYKTTHEAIRRYDKNHLIFGDRYEANAPIADEVINAALPYVDVLSFQDFRDPVKHLRDWHTKNRAKPYCLRMLPK